MASLATYVAGFFTRRVFGFVSRGRDEVDASSHEDQASWIRSRPRSAPARLGGVNLKPLHHPKDRKAFINLLVEGGHSVHINETEKSFGGAPIHSIIHHSATSGHDQAADLLMALLTYSKADIDLPDMDASSPLHIAIENGSLKCVRVLLTFGANPNTLNDDSETPLDIIDGKSRKNVSEMYNLLTSVGGRRHSDFSERNDKEEDDIGHEIPGGFTLELFDHEESADKEEHAHQEEIVRTKRLMKVTSGIHLSVQQRCYNYQMGSNTRRLYREMEDNINRDTNSMMSLNVVDEVIAMEKQRKELARYKATGSRVLSLDGGGMKGLIEVDVLEQLEQKTGKKIEEMFDWVVATSTGAIIILALLYAKKSLKEIRQLYFRLKDDVFSKPRLGVSCNTSALEKILKEVFGTEMTMDYDSDKMPKVIITAVNKKTKIPKFSYFSNFLDDTLSHIPVWKVARCTSAAPIMFEEFEDHVDGGVLANNPCETGLLKIEQFHKQKGETLPISLVVSIGTGINPPEKLGSVNAQRYLYFGPQWFTDGLNELKNLAELLGNALGESEKAASTAESYCEAKGIKYHRISPLLDDIVIASETSNEKLCHMVVSSRSKVREEIDEVVKIITQNS